MGSHARIETDAWLSQNELDPIGIPCGHQVINSAMNKRYCLGGQPYGTRGHRLSPGSGSHFGWAYRAKQFVWVLLSTGHTCGLKGPFAQALTLLRGVKVIAWRLRRSEKGNADGARGIFGTAGRVWAFAPRPDPP